VFEDHTVVRVRTRSGPAEEDTNGLQGGRQNARSTQAATQPADSEGLKILALIGRPKGVPLTEIRADTDWHAHSMRGSLSSASESAV
jgi:hypothetical protein